MGHELLEQEKKTGDLRRRSKQAILHLTFTEIRINQMEQQIRKLEAELYNKPNDFQLNVMRRQAPTYKSFIKRSSHGEFLQNLQSVMMPSHEQASLELLVADHGTSATYGSSQDAASHSTSTCQRRHQQTPERLRIRYAPLIKVLEKVCRETLSNYNFWPGDPGDRERTACSPTVLLRPWKLIVAYETEIRDSVRNIDACVQPARPGDVSSGIPEVLVVENGEYYSP